MIQIGRIFLNSSRLYQKCTLALMLFKMSVRNIVRNLNAAPVRTAPWGAKHSLEWVFHMPTSHFKSSGMKNYTRTSTDLAETWCKWNYVQFQGEFSRLKSEKFVKPLWLRQNGIKPCLRFASKNRLSITYILFSIICILYTAKIKI